MNEYVWFATSTGWSPRTKSLSLRGGEEYLLQLWILLLAILAIKKQTSYIISSLVINCEWILDYYNYSTFQIIFLEKENKSVRSRRWCKLATNGSKYTAGNHWAFGCIHCCPCGSHYGDWALYTKDWNVGPTNNSHVK